MNPLEYDPDRDPAGEGIYALPFAPEVCSLVLLPVPWEATVSYGEGAAAGPAAILAASHQVDLEDAETGAPYRRGIALLPEDGDLRRLGADARADARRATEGADPAGEAEREAARMRVNARCEQMNRWVRTTAEHWLERGRLVGVVGGDHSSPFGLVQALGERHAGLGILHVDAHADLRAAYQGFRWSHASIMHNVLEHVPGVARIVQVGIRDFSREEDARLRAEPERLRIFTEAENRTRLLEGAPWSAIAREAVEALPEAVYVSFDIDGLDPSLCPHTGTPVPGGLSFPEAVYLLGAVARSGRRIVGFDLCEVAPDPTGRSEWDANVGARILYKLAGFALATHPVAP